MAPHSAIIAPAQPQPTNARYPLWKSCLVLISMFTDPIYVRMRVGRLFRRITRSRYRADSGPSAPPSTQTTPPARRRAASIPASRLNGLEVDLVYLWVRGQDPVHRAKRDYWLRQYGLEPAVANPDVRYVESDELRYSLRAAELFLPWIRRVFLVTDDQAPEWLNVNHSKLTIVDHTEIASRQDFLPTFNSYAIEAQLHNIPGLAEHFIYCNDDFFFGQPCHPGDFFAQLPGKPDGEIGMRVMLAEPNGIWVRAAHRITHDPLDQLWMASWNNVKVAFELRHPWRRVRYLDNHQANGMTKTALRSATQSFARDYERTCASKFRSVHSMHFLALAKYCALANGTAVRGWLPSRFFQHERDLRSYSRATLPPLFCINGGASSRDTSDDMVLERLFPQASSFESTSARDASFEYPDSLTRRAKYALG